MLHVQLIIKEVQKYLALQIRGDKQRLNNYDMLIVVEVPTTKLQKQI